jgi:hypothetical protein
LTLLLSGFASALAGLWQDLILHSEDDLRCPVANAEGVFEILCLLRRRVELVRFPAESHELTRSGSPAHRVMRFEAIEVVRVPPAARGNWRARAGDSERSEPARIASASDEGNLCLFVP